MKNISSENPTKASGNFVWGGSFKFLQRIPSPHHDLPTSLLLSKIRRHPYQQKLWQLTLMHLSIQMSERTVKTKGNQQMGLPTREEWGDYRTIPAKLNSDSGRLENITKKGEGKDKISKKSWLKNYMR